MTWPCQRSLFSGVFQRLRGFVSSVEMLRSERTGENESFELYHARRLDGTGFFNFWFSSEIPMCSIA